MMAGLLFCAFAFFAAGHAGVTAHSIVPSLYTLDLFLDTAKNTFSGLLVIDASVQTSGAVSFTLNNNGLDIATVSVVQGGSNIFSAMVTNRTTQTTKISTSQGLTSGANVQVTISYMGNVSTEPTGLYSFVDKGSTIYMTNLYPVHARKLFPCFDEPGIATPIALSLTIPEPNGQLIASTSIASSTAVKQGYFYQLATTIPIAPYSLFFTLGNWDSGTYSLQLNNSRVYVPPSLKGQSNLIDVNLMYASSNPNITMLMPFFLSYVNVFISPVLASNSYTGLNTVVLKTDISVVDLDETTMAIEKSNLLQITYAFYRLFYGTYSRPATWGNNWLTRSIPMYLSYQSLDNIGTYGSSDASLVTGLYEQVFETSWSEDSPVPYTSNPLTTPQEIIAFITSSGVEKGTYAIKSLESFVDPGLLQNSLINYLIRTNGTTMETEDFMKFLNSSLPFTIPSASSSPSSLGDVLRPMVSEPGYPLIRVTRSEQTLAMLKSSFAVVSSSKSQSYADITQLKNVANWLIPISISTWTSPSTKTPSIYFMDPGSSSNQVVLAGTFPINGWALLDLEGKGMMRVSYDLTSWMLFRANGIAAFSPAMRAKLIADAFATAESTAEGSSWIATLAYLEYLDNETELAPWQAALAGFRRMWSWVYQANDQNLTSSFVTYWGNRLTKIYTTLGTKGSNGDQMDPLRRDVVSAMCELGGSNCTADLSAQYQSLVNNGNKPSADMYAVVVCNGVRGFTTVDQWNSVYQNYVKSGKWYSQQLMNSHYSFLACPANSVPITQYLNNVLLNTQSMMFAVNQVVPAVTAILDRPEHVNTVLTFIVQNQASLNITQDLQAEIIRALGHRISTNAQVQQLQTLTNTTRGLPPTLITAIQEATTRGAQKATWVSKVQADVQKGLNGTTPTPAPTPAPTGPTGGTTNGTTGGSTSAPTTLTPPTPKGGNASVLTVSIFTLLASFFLLKVTQ